MVWGPRGVASPVLQGASCQSQHPRRDFEAAEPSLRSLLIRLATLERNQFGLREDVRSLSQALRSLRAKMDTVAGTQLSMRIA